MLIGGSLFSSLLNAIDVQESVSQILKGIETQHGAISVLGIMMVIVFIMGMFIDGTAITVLTMPIFFPVVISANIHPLWFGILFTVNIVMGYLTRPFGMNLFYMKGITSPEISMEDIYKSIFPYVGIMIIVLIVVMIFPEIAVWFPNAIIK